MLMSTRSAPLLAYQLVWLSNSCLNALSSFLLDRNTWSAFCCERQLGATVSVSQVRLPIAFCDQEQLYLAVYFKLLTITPALWGALIWLIISGPAGPMTFLIIWNSETVTMSNLNKFYKTKHNISIVTKISQIFEQFSLLVTIIAQFPALLHTLSSF